MGPTKIDWKRKPAYLSRYLKNVIGPYDLYMILRRRILFYIYYNIFIGNFKVDKSVFLKKNVPSATNISVNTLR